MKKYVLVLSAVIWALGAGVVATAQAAVGAPAQGAAGALGNAQAVDETALAIGDQAAPAATGAKVAAPSTTLNFLRMVLVLALLVVVMYVVFRLLKRAGRPTGGEDAAVRVLATRGLGPGRALFVVALGDKAYLIGATDASVSLIDRIEDKDLIDALELRASSSAAAPKGDFGALLGSLLGKGHSGNAFSEKATAAQASGEMLGSGYLARQRERLRKYKP